MAETRDTTVGGVTLAQFAFVRAGLAEQLTLEELLGFLPLDTVVWEAAVDAWDDRVLDAVGDGDLALLAQLDVETTEARTHWTRRVPPLDEDLRGWLAFLQRWKSDPEPVEYLRRMGLSPADMAYVHRRWSERMSTDAKLREDALAMMGEDLGEPPVPVPERPRLLRSPRAAPAGDNVTADIARGKGTTLPFAEGEPAPPPPPLSVPLPRRKRPRTTAPGVEETGHDGGGSAASEAPLPFVAADAVAQAPHATDAAPVDVASGAVAGEAHEPAIERNAPSMEEPPPPALVVPRIAEPTLILPVTRALLAPGASPGARPDLDRSAAIRGATGEVIPFAEAFGEARPAAPGSALTLEQHAELVADLTTTGDLAGLLARHGLTAEGKQREDERWAREVNGDLTVRRSWMRAFGEARARLAAKGEKS